MLQTLVTGQVHSKAATAAWAMATLDPRWTGLIQRALAKHAGQFERVYEKADPQDFESTLAFIADVMAESDRLYPEGRNAA
jgi:hypothetical protein